MNGSRAIAQIFRAKMDEEFDKLVLNEEDHARIRHVQPFIVECMCTFDKETAGLEWSFRHLPGQVLKQMIEEHLADRNDRVKDAPTLGSIVDWILDVCPSFTAHGYIRVSKIQRRMYVEGVEHCGRATDQELKIFRKAFGCADEFVMRRNHQFAWYAVPASGRRPDL